jgi:hypothetical protein
MTEIKARDMRGIGSHHTQNKPVATLSAHPKKSHSVSTIIHSRVAMINNAITTNGENKAPMPKSHRNGLGGSTEADDANGSSFSALKFVGACVQSGSQKS